MPKELNEISGISFVNDHVLACVQDEKGIIFLYDLKHDEVIKKITFAEKGDYEGIAIVGSSAYIITGNGILYEVTDFLTDPNVNTYNFDLQEDEETEAICYDKSANRLLLASKNKKKEDPDPGLYEFDLSSKKFSDTAVIKVDLNSSLIKRKDRNNLKKLWQPADIAVDQINKRIMVVDAVNRHLMELSLTGELVNMIPIDEKRSARPEGIAIAADGSIYICNDSNNEGKGKIMKLSN